MDQGEGKVHIGKKIVDQTHKTSYYFFTVQIIQKWTCIRLKCSSCILYNKMLRYKYTFEHFLNRNRSNQILTHLFKSSCKPSKRNDRNSFKNKRTTQMSEQSYEEHFNLLHAPYAKCPRDAINSWWIF